MFPFHTARVFDKWEINYVKDIPNEFSSWFVSIVGFWFMALLFVIAGYSTFQALTKRTRSEYVNERVKRLLLPLLFGLVLIVPIQGYCAMLQQQTFTGNYLQFLSRYFLDFHDISGYTGGFTPAHLWFILYLFIISLCLLPLTATWSKKQSKVSDAWLFIPAFVLLTLAEALPAIGSKNIFFYALLFWYGYLIARSPTAMDTIRRLRFLTLAGALIITPVYYIVAGSLNWPSGVNLTAGVVALFRNLAVWLIILALMGLADAYLNKPSPMLSYANRAAFPVYVLHQSVLIAIAYFVVAADLSPAVKYIAIMLGTLAACLAIYEVCRRFKATRFILGIKGK